MTFSRAQMILSALHKGDVLYETEAEILAALEMVSADPKLATWWEAEQKFDAALSTKLKSIPVPVGLSDEIMAARKIVSFPPLWAQPQVWSVAALVAVLAVGFWSFSALSNQPTVAEFRQTALEFLSQDFELQVEGMDNGEMRKWIAVRGFPNEGAIPDTVNSLDGFGCRTLSLGRTKAALICFKLGKGEAHLLVVNKADLRNLKEFTLPQIETTSEWTTAIWSDSRNLYVLASDATRAEVEGLF